MKPAPPDGSRDRAIDDPTNIWFVHYVGRLLLPFAIRAGIGANPVSVAGLLLGMGAALTYVEWRDPAMATLGFLLCVAWLIADGLDGMIARATASASALGRFLDGACDHAVFLCLYIATSVAMGIGETWPIATLAGCVHAVQSSLYEAERIRFQRRMRGEPYVPAPRSPYLLARIYDSVASSLDRVSAPLDRMLEGGPDRAGLLHAYRQAAAPVLRLMIPLTNNMRVVLLWIACLVADPSWFWWITLVPLSLVAAAGIARLRQVEAKLVRHASA
ncbi:MAG TPA: CDP-alcohol phosphatidyltransferase family protein [Allosphingosinicella sp.]